MGHATAGIFDAVELFKRFRKSAAKNQTKQLNTDILESKLVLSRGPDLDALRNGKVLSVAPFTLTTVCFWTEPKYKGQPMSKTLGWKLAALLWDDEDGEMHLFAELGNGEIALLPKKATAHIAKGLTYWLAHCWAGVLVKNPTSDWWGGDKPGARGGTQHYFTKEPGDAPEAWHVHGTVRNAYSWASIGKEYKPTHSSDVRSCLACYVERGRGELAADKHETLEARGYQIWNAGELVDDQAGRLMAERGVKAKALGEWIAVKISRRNNYLRGQGRYVPKTRLSDN